MLYHCLEIQHTTPRRSLASAQKAVHLEHHLDFSAKQLMHEDYAYTNIDHCLWLGTYSYNWVPQYRAYGCSNIANRTPHPNFEIKLSLQYPMSDCSKRLR